MTFSIADFRLGKNMKQRSWIQWLNSCSDNRKSKIQNRKWGWGIATVLTFAMFGAMADAQLGKVPRIGFLSAASLSSGSDRVEAFRQGLRDLGYIEGQNVLIEYRYGEGKRDRLPALAAELVRLNG
jgi:hypothetical protein